MKKTLTAAFAVSAIAGLALAVDELATAPVGIVEATGSSAATLVCNPFLTIDGTAATTLGDIDGSKLASDDYIMVVGATGAVLQKAKWYNGHWYAFSDNTYATTVDSYSLPRGTAVTFVSAEGKTISFSGVLSEENVSVGNSVKGNLLVGNVSAVAKTLGDFQFSAFDAARDYVQVGSTKYVKVTKNGVTKWCERDAYQSATSFAALTDYSSLAIPSGAGVRVYNGKAKTSATVTLPGTL